MTHDANPLALFVQFRENVAPEFAAGADARYLARWVRPLADSQRFGQRCAKQMLLGHAAAALKIALLLPLRPTKGAFSDRTVNGRF